LEIDRPGITMIRLSELLEVMLAKGSRNRLPVSIVKKLAHPLVMEGRVRDLSA